MTNVSKPFSCLNLSLNLFQFSKSITAEFRDNLGISSPTLIQIHFLHKRLMYKPPRRHELPFDDSFLRPNSCREQVVPVVHQLLLLTAVSHPDLRHTGNSTCHTQQVRLRAAMLISDQQALIRCFTLNRWNKETFRLENKKRNNYTTTTCNK